jgi:signal transduction histidine kinase
MLETAVGTTGSKEAAARGLAGAFSEDRFQTRARALFYARIAFLALGLGALAVKPWSRVFDVGRAPIWIYLSMIACSAALLSGKRIGRLTFVTLCADLCVLVLVVGLTGGLRSRLLGAQLLFTALFVVLDLMVYLNERDRRQHREVQKLSHALREMAVVEERNRLSREIHDGVGGVLSSVVIQSEYLLNMIDGSEVRSRLAGNSEARAAIIPTIRKELSDLHAAAEDSMDELRRALRMMREDFDLVATLGEYCRIASARHRLDVQFSCGGEAQPVASASALALFRVLQEAVTNVAKHCGKGTAVDVMLDFMPGEARLRIQDSGDGFSPAEGAREGHYGLANMRERANKVGGRLRLTSAPGNGTRIELAVQAGGA